jgi:hypothetical protein
MQSHTLFFCRAGSFGMDSGWNLFLHSAWPEPIRLAMCISSQNKQAKKFIVSRCQQDTVWCEVVGVGVHTGSCVGSFVVRRGSAAPAHHVSGTDICKTCFSR